MLIAVFKGTCLAIKPKNPADRLKLLSDKKFTQVFRINEACWQANRHQFTDKLPPEYDDLVQELNRLVGDRDAYLHKDCIDWD